MRSAKRNTVKRPSSVDTVAENDELLTEILIRLRPKNSIPRFTCVSKHWNSLISSPNFTRRLNQYRKYPRGLLLPSYSCPSHYNLVSFDSNHDSADAPAPFMTLDFVNPPRHSVPRIIQSCNGLLLCHAWNDIMPNYYVYNPTTKKYSIIPVKPGFRFVSLAFDPLKSPNYELVCVRPLFFKERQNFQIEIYSSITRSWRISVSPFTTSSVVRFDSGVFCNGAIHWISGAGGRSLHFNLDQKQFKEMPMPPRLISSVLYFGESRGSLHLAIMHPFAPKNFFVYEMGKDYSGWSVKFWVDLYEVIRAFPEVATIPLDFDVVCVVKGEDDENSSCVLVYHGKIISYDFESKTCRKICDLKRGKRALEVMWCDAHQYIESSACV